MEKLCDIQIKALVPDVVAINTHEVLLVGQEDQKLTIKCKEHDRLVIDNVETDVRAITKVRLPRHLSCTLSSQSFTLKTDITQKHRLKPIQLEFAVGEVIKQKDVNFKKLISPEVNKLVSKRRKGLIPQQHESRMKTTLRAIILEKFERAETLHLS